MKAIQTTNNQGGKLSSKFHFRNNNYIKHSRNLNRTGLLSAFTFLLLALTCLFPISKGEQNTEAVTGTAQSSSLTLNVSSAAASVELDVNSTDGTFASSSSDNSAAFSVVTNNFSGYTLSISGSDNDGKLYDTTKKYFLEPLTSAVSEADFSSTSSLNGKWGYKPSKFNSAVNNNYLPAPTTTASTLDTTSVANPTANNYTISLGLRADYGTAANTYTNAFVITAVPNPIAYVITYDANTTDTVSNMPASQNSTTSATEIILADKTPAREGYDFKGWCTTAPTVTNPDTCTGTIFQPGDSYGVDQTTENITTLYAMWEENIAITYDANGGYFNGDTAQTMNLVYYNIERFPTETVVEDSGSGSYSKEIVIPGATSLYIKFSCSVFDFFNYAWFSLNGAKFCDATNYDHSKSGTFVTPGDTVQIEAEGADYSYTLSIDGVKAVVTSGVEGLIPVRPGYTFLGWYKKTEEGFGEKFTIVDATTDTGTVYAKWTPIMQDYTLAQCQVDATNAPVTIVDSRDNKSYTVRYINGKCWMTQNLDFNMTSGMTLSSSTTNVTTNRTIATVGSLTSGNSYDEPRIYNSTTAGYGTYYNYAAVTAGTITNSSNSTEATQDICPKGWRLPAGSSGQGQTLLTAGKWQTYDKTYQTAFNPVATGRYYDGSLTNSGSYGFWWSSTAFNATGRYNLYYDTSDGLYSGFNFSREGGVAVRCVLK